MARPTVIRLKPPCQVCGTPIGAFGSIVPDRHCASCRFWHWLGTLRERVFGFFSLDT